MAHKKAAGAAKNLRDSQPKYRWIKIFGGQKASKWNIIIRQNGSKYECWVNTYLAADFTIHASIDWLVHFKKKNFKRFDGRTYLKTVVEVLPETAKPADKPTKKAPTKTAKTEKKIEKADTPIIAESETSEAKPAKKAPAKKPSTTTKKSTKKEEKAE